MDKKKAIEIAQKYAGFVNSKFSVENIILFGSYAKGNFNENSDIDLAIIFKSVDDIIDLQVELLKMRTDDELLIEPHPFIVKDFNMSNPVAAEILRFGIELKNYAA